MDLLFFNLFFILNKSVTYENCKFARKQNLYSCIFLSSKIQPKIYYERKNFHAYLKLTSSTTQQKIGKNIKKEKLIE